MKTFRDWLSEHEYTMTKFSAESGIHRRKLCQWFNTGTKPLINDDIYAFVELVEKIDPSVNFLDFFRIGSENLDAEKLLK